MFLKSKYNAKYLQYISFCNTEIEICSAEIKLNSETIVIIGIYRPHSGTIVGFTNELGSVFSNVCLLNKRCIIAGDFNINICSNSSDIQEFISFMQSYHYISLITRPTRFSPNNLSHPTLLDHIWTNKISLYHSYILEFDFSDHCPTFYKFTIQNLAPDPILKTKISFRHYSEENQEKFRNLLESFDWSTIASDNIHMYVLNFSEKLNELYCISFPIKTKFISGKQALNPWINQRIRNLIKLKSDYFKLFRLGIITQYENNSFKNKIHSYILKAKSQYYKHLFEKNRNDIRSTWQTINSLINKSTNSRVIKKIMHNNVEYTDDLGMSEIFNEYFSNVATSLNEDLPINDNNPLDYITGTFNTSFFLAPVTPDECSSIIGSLKITKQDKNKIPVRLIISNRNFISPIVSNIINESMSQAIFPDSLKLAVITPIHKKHETTNPANYRPISVLPVLSKIFERIIFL